MMNIFNEHDDDSSSTDIPTTHHHSLSMHEPPQMETTNKKTCAQLADSNRLLRRMTPKKAGHDPRKTQKRTKRKRSQSSQDHTSERLEYVSSPLKQSRKILIERPRKEMESSKSVAAGIKDPAEDSNLCSSSIDSESVQESNSDSPDVRESSKWIKKKTLQQKVQQITRKRKKSTCTIDETGTDENTSQSEWESRSVIKQKSTKRSKKNYLQRK